MDYTPHALHQVLTRIREQMRCPQCGTPVAVDFPSVKVASEDFMLLELRCGSCSSFIVLHVQMKEESASKNVSLAHPLLNASSTVAVSDDEMKLLRKALSESDGSFEKMFSRGKKQA